MSDNDTVSLDDRLDWIKRRVLGIVKTLAELLVDNADVHFTLVRVRDLDKKGEDFTLVEAAHIFGHGPHRIDWTYSALRSAVDALICLEHVGRRHESRADHSLHDAQVWLKRAEDEKYKAESDARAPVRPPEPDWRCRDCGISLELNGECSKCEEFKPPEKRYLAKGDD